MPPAPSPEAAAFAERYALVSASNRRALERLAVLLTALQERGIDCLLLKGADFLTRVHELKGLRGIGDVDLLVREEDLDRIDAVMRGLGLRPKIDGNAAYMREDGDFPVDLASKIWYLEDERPVWERARSREALGLTVRAMEATDALLYLCAWVCLHRARLSTAFAQDAAFLIQKERIDWQRLRRDAEGAGLKIPLRHALDYARAKKGAAVPEGFLEALAPSSRAQRLAQFLLRRLVGEERVEGLSHFLVLATRRKGRRLSALSSALLPSGRFLSYRYGERSALAMLALRCARPFVLAGRAAAVGARVLPKLVRR
jgi:hypothetical protein